MKKKLMRMGLLAAVCAACLCVGALAADGVGINNLKSKSDAVILTPLDSARNTIEEETVDPSGEVETGYAEAAMVQVEVTNAEENNYYLVMALSDDTGVPTEDNIVYIDQVTAKDTTVTFTAYPKELTVDQTYYVYISGTDRGLEQVGSYKAYSTVAYVLGDANGDNEVDVLDAVKILKCIVGNDSFVDAQERAADANEDGSVDVTDAVTILKYIVGNGTLGKQ